MSVSYSLWYNVFKKHCHTKAFEVQNDPTRSASLINLFELGRIVHFGTPGWVRTSGLSLRRRPLYPTELRGHIQKIFNFTGLQDSNDSIFRRRTLYPTELRGLIQKIFNFAGLQDSNDSIFRRRPLYPTELRGLIQKLFNFTGLQDSNDSIFRRRSLYTTELQGHMQKYSIVQLRWTRDRQMLGGRCSAQLSYWRV